MVKTKQVYEDLDEICRLTNSIYFNYVKLISEDITQGSLFNLKYFLEKSKELLGNDHIDILKNHNVILPAPYGLYHINFDTKKNKGLNYNLDKGNLFFFTNDKTFSDRFTMYHEAAHSLQCKQNLFNEKEIGKVYDFLEQGLKIKNNNPLVEFVINDTCYKHYLKEMHSEAFAAACVLLHSKNNIDFTRISLLLMKKSALRTIYGIKDTRYEYPSLKYYASLPVLKATIKQIKKWKTEGTPNHIFLNNKINFEELSLNIAKLVWKNAYSPEIFKKYMSNEWKFHRNKEELNLKKDVQQSMPIHFFNRITSFFNISKSPINLKNISKKQDETIKFLLKKLPETSDENKGINFLKRAEVILYASGLENKTIKNKMAFLCSIVNKSIQNNVLIPHDIVKNIFSNNDVTDERVKQTTNFLNKMLYKNKDNDWLKTFTYYTSEKQQNDFDFSKKLREMYDMKTINPSKNIFNQVILTCDREDLQNNEKEIKVDVLESIGNVFYSDKSFRLKLSSLLGKNNFANLEKDMFKYQHEDNCFLFLPKQTSKLKEIYRPHYRSSDGKRIDFPKRSQKYKAYSAAFDEEIRSLQNLYFENNDSRFFRKFMKDMEIKSDYNIDTITNAIKNERKMLVKTPNVYSFYRGY